MVIIINILILNNIISNKTPATINKCVNNQNQRRRDCCFTVMKQFRVIFLLIPRFFFYRDRINIWRFVYVYADDRSLFSIFLSINQTLSLNE